MSYNYFDLPPSLSDYKNAKAVIVPAPYDQTASYVKGTSKGPVAILEASRQVELYDEELGFEPCEVGISSLPILPIEKLGLTKALPKVEEAIDKVLSDGKLPVLIGGEHSLTPPAVASVARHHPNLTVVQLDAHADLREEYDGSKWSHACAMARVREVCPAVQIGIRNLSKEEAVKVAKEKLPVFFAHKIKGDDKWMDEAIAQIKTDDVYLTFDVDAFDSSLLPDTGTPEPGGLDWYEVTRFIRLLSQKQNIVGMDFMELAPQDGHHASDFLVAKLIYKCLGYWALKHR